ncbi:sugar ABC transporter permease [Caldovatus sediminis]|uniref:Sugar ABC transporter permease n=1 Tax=Caldovatus sediminis TaxID=2041189 RepID=A0A8J2ZCC1_9PROT|nr:sugar ABC transporter permease [Caldovatus sediminis]GGG37866.1 sugar ABC transporter permease [Caldovatus sediminis]
MLRLGYDERAAALLVFPVVAVLLVVAAFPILYSFWISLHDVVLTRPLRRPFVGLDNYLRVFADERFWIAVARTTVYTVVTVAATTVLAVLVALLLNEAFPGQRLLNALLLLPWATPSVVNGLMWKWIYDPSYGLLNGLLVQLGVLERYRAWLGDPDLTLLLIANAAVWKQMPLAALLLIVTMKAIPEDLYRAAKVDGAGTFRRFLHVTLPALRPGLMLVLVYETMISIRHFDLFLIMTQGGPGDASFTLSWFIYVETFRSLRFGTGAALSYILAMATFLLSYLFIRFLGRRL